MTKTGMNMERVRRQNRSLILKYINDNGPSSRKDIALAAGLTQASVTQIVAALMEEGILKEGGSIQEDSKSAGRRKILLHIDEQAFLVFTVNMEPDITTVAVCDLMGEAVSGKGGELLVRRYPTIKKEPEDALERIAEVCRELKAKLPKENRKKIDALSFAATGIIDAEKGIACRAYGIWEKEVPVRSILQGKLRLPVLMENNVDAFAIAEQVFGAGKKEDDLFVIKWGPGVGSSVIIGGEVFRGNHGKTAEMGHFIVDPEGAACNCGRRGCLETKVSAKALTDCKTKEEKRKAVRLFARSIVNAGTILSPGRIILFGSLSEDEKLRAELISGCAAYDPAYNEQRILHSILSGKEGYIGPAAVYTRFKFW